MPGIKVDRGTKPLAGCAGETITAGLDGLRDRLGEYYELGAGFAKWRAVIRIGDTLPSRLAIDANAHALARYAALCQEAGLVPIVEPEVLMDGPHDIQRCQDVTTATLKRVFDALFEHCVLLEGMLLKPNMVLSGTECPIQAGVEDVAERTVRCFRQAVPAAVPGIVFLSAGTMSPWSGKQPEKNDLFSNIEAPPALRQALQSRHWRYSPNGNPSLLDFACQACSFTADGSAGFALQRGPKWIQRSENDDHIDVG